MRSHRFMGCFTGGICWLIVTAIQHVTADKSAAAQTIPSHLPSWYSSDALPISAWLTQARQTQKPFDSGSHALPGQQGVPATWYAKDKEDRHAWYSFFYRQRQGVFVEVGAGDGIKNSNTNFFEQLGWRGMLIEADPKRRDSLVKNRGGSVCVLCGVCGTEGEVHWVPGKEEEEGGEVLEMLSKEARSAWHQAGLQVASLTTLPCFTLKDVLQYYKFDQVNLMSVNVGGAEMQVLEAFDFSAVQVDVWVIACDDVVPGKDVAVKRLMARHGYNFEGNHKRNNWFVHKKFEPSRDASIKPFHRAQGRPKNKTLEARQSLPEKFLRPDRGGWRHAHMVQRPTFTFPEPKTGSWAYFIGIRPDRLFFIQWALASIQSLQAHNTRWDITVFVEGAVDDALTALYRMNVTRVIKVEDYLNRLPLVDAMELWDANKESESMYFHAWNKLLAWTMTDYERVVAIDADIVAWNNMDELFWYPEMAAAPDMLWPLMSEDYIEYFNTGLMVLRPSMDTFSQMTHMLRSFSRPIFFWWDVSEQTFINFFFDGSWYPLPLSYNYVAFLLQGAIGEQWNIKYINAVHHLRESQHRMPPSVSACKTSAWVQCVLCCEKLVTYRDDALSRLRALGLSERNFGTLS